jgi:phosphatidate cytidylyltransferase
MSNLLKRALSSIVFVPGILLLIWQGGVYFHILCFVLTAFMLYEWAALWIDYFNHHALSFKHLTFILLGVVYISVAMFKFWTLKDDSFRQFMTFLIVWSTDVGAYFVGKKFGKIPFSPTISPKKTWEGFWGGVISCVLVCSSVMYIQLAGLLPYSGVSSFISNFFTSITLFSTFVFSIRFMFYSMAAHLGDLVESWAKRYLGVKDSSQLIPGHGGFLDRFDSFLGVCLAYYLKDILHYYGIFF